MKKHILLISLILIFFVAACDRYIDSRDPLRTLPGDIPIPQSIDLFINNQSIELSWNINGSGINRYRIYASQDDTSHFKVIDSTTTTDIVISNLTANRVYFFEIASVSTDGLEGIHSDRVSAQVGVMNMRISDNDEYTNSRSVQIRFTISNTASFVMISEDSTFANVLYEPFSLQRSFELSDGDGVKQVFARIQFSSGAESGELIRDSIILDTEARIDSVYFNLPNFEYAPADTIRFTLDAGEPDGTASVSFPGSGRIDMVDDGTGMDPVASDGIYNGWYVVPFGMNVLDGTVTGEFTDRAGNIAPSITSYDLINVNTMPESVELVIQFVPGGTATLNWTGSTEPDFESYRIYRGSTSTVTVNDALIHYETGIGTRTFEYSPPPGTTYYRVMVFDAHGAYSLSNVVSITN